MSNRPARRRWLIALGAAALLAVPAGGWWLRGRDGLAEPIPLPAYTESPYRNAGPDVHPVGSAACTECHRARHQSYLLTAHSRSLADVEPGREPPDAEFAHTKSGRVYRVYRDGGRLRHAEIVRDADGAEVTRIDVPVRYLIGSGSFSRSYLVEIDGFLFESPITWYPSRQRWDLSPGYDQPAHWSFERPVNENCLFCHAGQVATVGDTVHRMAIPEQAIGCESCHGPGSLHVAWHRANPPAAGADDLTIVNPGKLPRPLQEAVCASCHLSGPATVALRGRQLTDFRPGRPLTDYRIDYEFDTADMRMTVVGHFGQLRQSACYQKSADLTCLTCHDPHAREKPADVPAAQRQMCLACHGEQACRLGAAERRRREPADNCVSCHMPRGDTDIPHIAFTHHRIGRHAARPTVLPAGAPALVPVAEPTALAALDRDRNLGLAYLEASRHPEYARYEQTFRAKGQALLQGAHEAGLREAATSQALAECWWRQDRYRAAEYAREALADREAPAGIRVLAQLILADGAMKDHQLTEALERFNQVVRLRYYAEDWRLLGVCRLELNQPNEALAALRQALALRPTQPATHAAMAEAYRRLGDAEHAREHRQKAQWLSQHHQQ